MPSHTGEHIAGFRQCWRTQTDGSARDAAVRGPYRGAALMAGIGETGDWARRRRKARRHPQEKRDASTGP